MERPMVGIGIIIENTEHKILIGKRKGSHSPFYSIPGGHIELGETFEQSAIKEVFEETGLIVQSPKVIAVTNNLRTYKNEKKHYISVILYTNRFEGTAKVLEKNKCEFWEWFEPTKVPDPHFDASEFAIECFIKNQFYIPDQH
ncbi:MAG: NUDIX domain-containing protein [Bacteroidetes bacterium]|nr:NUDIX domain-containing protein [Bacteroidota bacterium]